MKQWIIKWFKQVIGQSFFHTAPIAIVILLGVIITYFLPAQYAMPLIFIVFIVVGYFFIRYSKWF